MKKTRANIVIPGHYFVQGINIPGTFETGGTPPHNGDPLPELPGPGSGSRRSAEFYGGPSIRPRPPRG